MSIAPSPRPRGLLPAGAAVLAGLAILHLGSPGGLPQVASDLWTYRAERHGLARDEERSDELDERVAVAAARTDLQSSLHDRLAAGRVTLRAACAEFGEYTGSDPGFDRLLRVITAGADDPERLANYLLTSLTRSRQLPPGTHRRLADEFRAEFGRDPQFQSFPSAGDIPAGPVGRHRTS